MSLRILRLIVWKLCLKLYSVKNNEFENCLVNSFLTITEISRKFHQCILISSCESVFTGKLIWNRDVEAKICCNFMLPNLASTETRTILEIALGSHSAKHGIFTEDLLSYVLKLLAFLTVSNNINGSLVNVLATKPEKLNRLDINIKTFCSSPQMVSK